MKPLTKPIVPHLWFDKEAKEATELYCSVFPDSRVDHIRTITGTPSGDCDIVSFSLAGQSFQAISAGPYFKTNPSISFMVNYDPSRDPKAKKNLDAAWAKISEGGKILMPLQEYPFSKHYGWVQDRFGVSWQLILTDPNGEPRPFIIPSLLFVKEATGRAEEAINFYTSVFPEAKAGQIARYPAGMEPEKEGTVMFGEWQVNDQWFTAMDSANPGHDFNFNEAISFIISCADQAEIDYYWEKLSAVPESEQCGWVKDKFGVSWQITPARMDEMMADGSRDQIDRVTQAFLPMKKMIIADLEKAYAG
jgi:predicted 3-demethylubiquinone-9 3-methyltransferase (glyoxalase superfamily)